MVNRRRPTLLLLLCALVGGGCSEEFTPKPEIRESVVVYAVAEAYLLPTASTTVTAVVMRSFDVEGLNPAGATIDPSIRGAVVRVSGKGRIVTLQERRKPGVDSLTGIGPRWCYAGPSIAARAGDTISLTVDLPDGRHLSAHTQIPSHREPTLFPEFRGIGVSTPNDPYFYGTAWVFDWPAVAGDQDLFFPSLVLIYEHQDSSGWVGYGRQVPLRLVEKGGGRVPEYPVPTTESRAEYTYEAMDATMRAISDGDPEKGRYRITGFQWRFIEFDFPFSRYYSSVNGYLDAYSVRLDESVFSNIAGGIGVFGSTYAYSVLYPIDSRYAEEFGYTSP